MNKKQKKIIIIILTTMISLLILPFGAYGILWLTIPISRPNNAVRSYVLKKLSMETSWSETVEKINEENWEIIEVLTDRGVVINYEAGYVGMPFNGLTTDLGEQVVGAKSVLLMLGEYNGPFNTVVFAYLAFDENNKLIDVFIEKEIDAL